MITGMLTGIVVILGIMASGLREEIRAVLDQCDRLEKKIRELKEIIEEKNT